MRLDHHPVLDLGDLHAGVTPDDFGEDALVVRGQVLHQYERHARISVGGHAGEKGLERRQPPGRSANADDGEGRLCRSNGRYAGKGPDIVRSEIGGTFRFPEIARFFVFSHRSVLLPPQGYSIATKPRMLHPKEPQTPTP